MKHDELIDLLKKIPEREPPPELHGRIMRAVRAKERTRLQRLADLFSAPLVVRIHPLRLAAMGFACTLFFALGILAGKSPLFSGGQQPTLPQTVADDRANYFIGRALLAAGDPARAARYLSRAALLAPGETSYEFWQGVAYGLAGQRDKERSSYNQVISMRPDYLPALVNLGHNLLQSGELDRALALYDRVLRLAPANREALYNRGLVFHLQGRRRAEARAWKKFLATYRTGRWAFRAVAHLNNLGDFSYRAGRIGPRKIIFHQAALLGSDAQARDQEIRLLAGEIARTPSGPLNLVLFRAGDPAGARKTAIRLQALFARQLKGKRVSVSWFGQPEKVHSSSGTQYELKSGLLLFSAPATGTNISSMEKRI